MKKILIIFALLFLSAIVLVVARQPSQEQSPNQEALCLITVNGQVYNVAKLRSTHPGGDICVRH
jgi:asparagine synthetase B (glutamine-hydrolysing)